MKKITYIFFASLLFALNTSQAQVQRVRLAFESPTGYVRPLLLGFDPTNTATDGVDFGWDTLNFYDIPGDLNWLIDGDRYIVQGVGAFDETKKYPLGLFLTYSGTFKISLEALENFNIPIDVYIYDAHDDKYKSINNANYVAHMSSGDYLDKYFIAFLQPTLSSNEIDFKETKIQYLSKTKELYINTHNNFKLKQISIHNLLGQEILFLKDTPNGRMHFTQNTPFLPRIVHIDH